MQQLWAMLLDQINFLQMSKNSSFKVWKDGVFFLSLASHIQYWNRRTDTVRNKFFGYRLLNPVTRNSFFSASLLKKLAGKCSLRKFACQLFVVSQS